MNVELDLPAPEDWRVLANLWPLYVHDISAFNGARPNRHGVLSDDDAWGSLEDHGASIRSWWQDGEALKPYVIRVDGAVAGFQLNATHPYLAMSIEADWVIHEFFLLHAFRDQVLEEFGVHVLAAVHSHCLLLFSVCVCRHDSSSQCPVVAHQARCRHGRSS